MKKEASVEKVQLARNTCLNILKNNNISKDYIRKFVSSILDAIDLVGEDEPFTLPQEKQLVREILEELNKNDK